jgi:uncharacterized protein YdhG (YjbR/CyaY superfamily)
MIQNTFIDSEVDNYISQFPLKAQKVLRSIRKTIHKAIPDAEEIISYKMPAYKYKGKVLIYFAGYNKHIGLYATPTGHKQFAKELAKYKQGKGSAQFPLDETIPLDLIARIAQFRKEEIDNL